jgi:polyisoprenoid-binding protein YceI
MSKPPGDGTRRRKLTIAVGGGLAVLVIAFLLVYFVIFPTSSPKPFKLSNPTTTTSAASTGTTSTPTPTSATGLSGTWNIASGSQAGYRVREKLAFLPAQSDAVGRTSSVTGGATFTESGATVTITAAKFSIAVNTLKSDRSMRDEKIRSIGLESERFPTATFALSSPLKLPVSAITGKVAHASVTGVVEIHGTSRRETLPVELSLSGSTLQAAGSLTFPWSEFGMTAPSVGGFVNVTEHATMEFDLRLQRA